MMMQSPSARDSSVLSVAPNHNPSTLTAPWNTSDLEARRAQLTLNHLSQSVLPSFRFFRRSSPSSQKYDITSTERLAASHNDHSFDLSAGFPELRTQLKDLEQKEKTVLYLAYGSNLCHETFQGRRGIKPLSAVNVVVPGLRLTFDLPGVPYVEPCFANSGLRDEKQKEGRDDSHGSSQRSGGKRELGEKTPLICRKENGVAAGGPYHKDAWKKGLVGVVYELTPTDFAHVIATEGGGSSYHDILIPCYTLSSNPSDPVPWDPSTPSLLAHTLFAPAEAPPPPPHQPPPAITPSSISRPDPSYAQPSARYLKLITDGAAEHDLPTEYRTFLSSIRPFTTSTAKQRLGAFIFTSLWHPIIVFLFGLNAVFGDNVTGRNPEWVMKLMAAIFAAVWASYDNFFERLFGDGERSIPDGGWEGEKGHEEERQNVLRRAKGAGLIKDDPEDVYGSRGKVVSGSMIWNEKREVVEEV